ncbi:hypothetical protein AB0O20_12530 [Streptomyces kronopolitis]|uniref:hypothetical protein n=1 Tax=Streptomyces kronopolitis TaxID=1612435 RepID=UPI003447CB9F
MLASTAWPPAAPAEPARRRLVQVRRVPPGLLPPCDEDGGFLRPYARGGEVWQSAAQQARRRELEESVRRLNTWSSGGGGRS